MIFFMWLSFAETLQLYGSISHYYLCDLKTPELLKKTLFFTGIGDYMRCFRIIYVSIEF